MDQQYTGLGGLGNCHASLDFCVEIWGEVEGQGDLDVLKRNC